MVIKAKMMTPVLIGAAVLAAGSAIPFINLLNCLCCGWVVLGGVMAAYLYVGESPQKVSLGDGAILGALSGAIGSVFYTLLSLPIKRLTAPFMVRMVYTLLERLQISEDLREQILSSMQRRSGLGTILGEIFVWLVIGLIFATLGGIIGVAIFEKRKNGAVIVPPPPVPPPTPPAVPPAQ